MSMDAIVRGDGSDPLRQSVHFYPARRGGDEGSHARALSPQRERLPLSPKRRSFSPKQRERTAGAPRMSADHRSDEISSLRGEIASLRATVKHPSELAARLERPEHHALLDDGRAHAAHAADPKKSWDLAEKIHDLNDKVRSLEVDKMTLTQQLQRTETGGADGAKYTVTGMMREREEATHKLHLEETKRKSVEQRARAAEEELEAESAEQEYRTRRATEEM